MGHRFQPRRLQPIAVVLFVFLIGSLLACDPIGNQAGPEQSPAKPASKPTPDAGPTIVSLTPAVTQMLIDMGKRDLIVGVSREDDASLGLPACGSYNDPIMAKILELEPDIVITETPFGERKSAPSMLRSLADRGIFELAVIPHSRSIAGVERALTDAEGGLGKIVGDPDAGERARNLMAARLELIHTMVEDADRPRVLILIEPSTLGALGPGATHDEMLQLAGGVNAVADYKTAYIKLDRAQIQQVVRPDVVLIIEPNGRPIQDNDPRLRALEGLAVPAIIHQRIVVIDHPQAMLPSTQIAAVTRQIAMAIHPDQAEAIDKAYAMAERAVQRESSADEGAP